MSYKYVFWLVIVFLFAAVAIKEGAEAAKRKEMDSYAYKAHCAMTGETATTADGRIIRAYKCDKGLIGRTFWTE